MKNTNYDLIQKLKNADSSDTIEIVINNCYGGFSVSEELYKELGLTWNEYGDHFNDNRTNPDLVAAVKLLGDKANGECSELKVLEIDLDDVLTGYIENNDGKESITYSQSDWGCYSIISMA